jgi:hypothetical protein
MIAILVSLHPKQATMTEPAQINKITAPRRTGYCLQSRRAGDSPLPHVSPPMGDPIPVLPEWLNIPYMNIVPAKDTSYTPHVIPKTDEIRLGDTVTEKDGR